AEDNEKREKHIHRIKDSVNHMNELLEDFLSLGRLEEGKVSIVPASFDLKVFVTEVADEMQGLLKKEQEIKIDYQGDPVFVSDKRMLKNILLNLLSNASKFSAEGKPISVTVSNTNRLLIITVKDEGIGIPAADLPHLFDSFYRGANASNIQGTGLGLPIIKRYLDLLRGDITVSSKLDEGTGIRVSVPAAEF
ncbi:MAG TPA: HAMP domain-containing sensor histidine kinase, partial [Chitinophagaceae bacterium]|nr:HAMP domain-containing sensor histidine kinase [Chitinophagaceae bacterium]